MKEPGSGLYASRSGRVPNFRSLTAANSVSVEQADSTGSDEESRHDQDDSPQDNRTPPRMMDAIPATTKTAAMIHSIFPPSVEVRNRTSPQLKRRKRDLRRGADTAQR
jgi:hypothetical protein